MTPPNRPPDDPPPPVDGDEAIPLLTEVLHLPQHDATDLPASLAEVDWATFAQQVQDNVIDRLMTHAQSRLDVQIREMLGPLLERTARQLVCDLETSLAEFTRELVARAVSEELTRVHAEIAQRGSEPPDPVGPR